MKRQFIALVGTVWILIVMVVVWEAVRAADPALDTAKIEQLTGGKGELNAQEGVFKVSVPRTDLAVTAAGVKSNPQVVVKWVLNGKADSTLPVFVRGSAPTSDYVKTTVEVAARGDRKTGYSSKILLEDGFYMRNLDAN